MLNHANINQNINNTQIRKIYKGLSGYSLISKLHFIRFIARSLLFLASLTIYILGRANLISSDIGKILTVCIAGLFMFEMFQRFFPSKYESMGCQKQFSKNYKARETDGYILRNEVKRQNRSAVTVLISWILLNGIIAALYYAGVIDGYIMILICLFYSVCDMVCILFFCPFQTLMMKNRCCGSCRIYNWDYAMMFTPLLFVNSWISFCLCSAALALLVRWEITYRIHPERFTEKTNSCLDCSNCKEKLCRHKKSIERIVREQKMKFFGGSDKKSR